ncbi:MAG: protein-L-isoaspartate(D-aspartate) O-methyltransferase [Planctomycetes bacterium]|nr:protein-L-isoaspartate(D-aspartate) O-methyltransferase [Planctomycetota bacterium]
MSRAPEHSAEFASERRRMVEHDLKGRGIKAPRVLTAFETVPRHRFVPEEFRCQSYDDHPITIGHGQTISQPYMVALMTQMLRLQGNERVLEIGTGSGYQTAVLAELAREVYTVERIAELSRRAGDTLDALGYENVHFRIGDGTLGWPEESPFDRILATAGAPKVPQPLLDQIAEGGWLVIPVGDAYSQTLVKAEKLKGMIVESRSTACVFVKLIGKEGWRAGE